MEITLKAQTRSELGKGPSRRARVEGKIPAVLYGTAVDATPLTVDAKEIWHALHTEAGANVLIHLKLDSQDEFLTMAREIQRHPVKNTVLHVDFISVDRDVKITAEIPIHIVGESHGVKEGGQLDQGFHEVRVEALPTEVPSSIEVDITEMGIGDQIRASDLTLPQGVELLNDPEDIIVSVIEPIVMKLEEEVEGEPEAEGEAPAVAEGEEPPSEPSE